MNAHVAARRDDIFERLRLDVFEQTDRLFAILFAFQWSAAILVALWLSPRAWAGTTSTVSEHVWTAIVLGGAIATLPVWLATARPGRASTRYVIAIGQMLFGALLIHLTGGRIETHFHVFGSLAFLALYRDWRVLIVASGVVVLDHAIRGLLLPQSIYGVLTPDAWRFLEHAGWVVFEDAILVTNCVRGVRELRRFAERTAEFEGSEARYLAVVEQLAEGILVFDAATLRILEFNRAFAHCAGATREALMGISLDKHLVGGDPGVPIHDEVDALLRSGRSTVSDRVLRTLDGQSIEVSCSLSPTTYAGRPAVCAVIRDISERNRIAAQLEQARDAAIASATMKAEFLANMSHEIRTPMNGVIGMASLLLGTGLSRHQRDLAETIQSSADALLRVIDDILDFSKIESGKLHFETLPFDLREVVDSTLDQFAERAFAKGVELIANINADVPDALVGDAGRLRQILVNLIGNALKFTAKGEVVVAIELGSSEGPDTCIRVEIRDSGIGIPESARHRLFEAFSQADGSTTRQFGGTGLGLVISKRLVEQFRGEIGFDSTVGVGTTFWFTVRCSRQVAPRSGMLRLALTGQRILIVDDNPAQRESLVTQITALGLRASAATGAQAALEELEHARRDSDPYAAAVVDQHMPGMDGVELAEHIRRDPELDLPVVLMTPFGVTTQADRPGAAAWPCLTKPVKSARLYEVLKQALAGSPRRVSDIQPVVPAGPSKLNARILLAEDNPVNQRVASLQLKRLGCTVDVVDNGEMAVEAVRNGSYDVVLMDCQMAVMDGYDASVRIRRLPGPGAGVPIIALTAHALSSDRDKCLEAGMNDFLTKPLKIEDLAATIERWLLRKACAS